MSFLSKLGKIFSKTAEVAATVNAFTPLAVGILPGGANGKPAEVFESIVGVILHTEATFGAAFEGKKTGKEKLKAAIPFVAGVLNTSSWMIDKKVADPVLFEAACEQLTEAMVMLTKAVEQRSPDEVNRMIQEAQATAAKLRGQYQVGQSGLSLRQ